LQNQQIALGEALKRLRSTIARESPGSAEGKRCGPFAAESWDEFLRGRLICVPELLKVRVSVFNTVGWFEGKVGHSRLRESFSQLLSCQSSSRLVLVLLSSPIHFELNLMNPGNESV
jgi:hypothetical protein